MIASTLAEIDLIEELRHRCWAREHYVAPAERDQSWHPVVLDEMRRKDRELRESQADTRPTPVVPRAISPTFVRAQLTP